MSREFQPSIFEIFSLLIAKHMSGFRNALHIS